MGFFKFLKKGEKVGPLDEALDVPPAPPPIHGHFPDDLPKFELKEEKPAHQKEEMRPVGFEEKLPMPHKEEAEFPPLEGFEEKLPEFPHEEPEAELPPLEDAPKFTPKPPIKEPVMAIPSPKREIHIEHEIEDRKPFLEKIEKEAIVDEKKLFAKRPTTSGPTYIRLDKFRDTLGSMGVVRGDLKKCDESLINLINKEKKDRGFERWRASMDDIQKKLIFVEKTLFKGD